MSTHMHITQKEQTEIVLNVHDLFKFGGDRKQKDFVEYRVGVFLRTIGLLFLILPVVWLVFNGDFAFSEITSPTQPALILSAVSFWVIGYGSYLARNKNIFDIKPEQHHLSTIASKISKGHIKRYELENAFTVEVLQMLDQVYAAYKDQFIAALSDYMINISRSNEFLESRLGLEVPSVRARMLGYFATRTTDFDSTAQEFFTKIFEKALALEADKIGEEVFLLVLVESYWKDFLKEFLITDLDIQGLVLWFKNRQKKLNYLKRWERLSKLKPQGPVNRAYTSKATPTLDLFAKDFTTSVIKNKFVLSIGRDSEINSLVSILEKQKNAAGMILGEAGVGKTHFLKYLATKMVMEDVPDALKDSRLVVIDLNTVFTKSGSLNEFKQALQKMLEEVASSGNIIVVLEDFAQVLSIRTEGRLEVINTITNLITQYNIKTIATTGPQSYASDVKPIKSLAALFTVVQLQEPSKTISLQLLLDESSVLERKYGVTVQVSAIKRIVEFAHKFDYERVMPDKGIALLEEAFIQAKNDNLESVDKTLIDELLSKRIGVQVGDIDQTEAEKLVNLESEMHTRVVGQDEAIKAVAAALRRARSGMVSGKKPIASFLFFGPTGVGKTEVAKTLAHTYYGDEKNMIRLDMSEYQEEYNLDRLIGYSDPNGKYIGGYLSESVRQKPFSLVLLDEIEKANPKVLDLFLQVLDEGHITDGVGRDIDFTNCIIIATSNAGSRDIAMHFEEGKSYQETKKLVDNELKNSFRVEFLNRFDRVIMFRPLQKISDVEQIVQIMLTKVRSRLLDKGMDMKWNELTLSKLAEKGYSKIYGARELNRVIQEEIEDKVANAIIGQELVGGKTIVFDGLDIIGYQ